LLRHPFTSSPWTSFNCAGKYCVEVNGRLPRQFSIGYPVTAIVNLAWQHTGLGDVTAAGQALTAATSGYSLLRITYTTTSLDWRVALPVDEEVQFVLVDQ
jgi:hypothetical protein